MLSVLKNPFVKPLLAAIAALFIPILIGRLLEPRFGPYISFGAAGALTSFAAMFIHFGLRLRGAVTLVVAFGGAAFGVIVSGIAWSAFKVATPGVTWIHLLVPVASTVISSGAAIAVLTDGLSMGAVGSTLRRWSRGAAVELARTSEHGSADWADRPEMQEMIKPAGVILGQIPPSGHKFEQVDSPATKAARSKAARRLETQLEAKQLPSPDADLVKIFGEGHGLVVARSGGGKSTCVVIPSLLLRPDGTGPGWTGPVMVVDPKKEIYRVTTPSRIAAGRKVYLVQPHKIPHADEPTDKAYRFNPLDMVPDSADSTFLPAIDNMVKNIIEACRDNNSTAVHFSETARMTLRGLMVIVSDIDRFKSEGIDLFGVDGRHLPALDDLFNRLMLKAAEDFNGFRKWLVDLMKVEHAGAGLAGRSLSSLLEAGENELGGIKTTIRRALDWMSDRTLREYIKTSDFDMRDVLAGKGDIYICVPDDVVESVAPWIRLMFRCAMAASYQVKVPSPGFLVFIDEMARIGAIASVLDPAKGGSGDLAVARGRGVRIWGVVQSLHQLKALYGQDGAATWRDLTDVLVVLGVAAGESSKDGSGREISELIGDTTAVSRNKSTNSGRNNQDLNLFGGSSTGWSESEQQIKRLLITPDEVRIMPDDQCLVVARGHRPMKLRKTKHFDSLNCPELAALSAWNPYSGQPRPDRELIVDLAHLAQATPHRQEV